MFKLAPIVFLFLSFLDAQLSRGQTISYPEINPTFTVEVPSGWDGKRENGAVTIKAEGNAVFLLQYVKVVKNEDAAKEALPQLAEFEGRQFEMKNMRIRVPAREAQMGDFKGFMTDGRGTDPQGNDTLWQVLIFCPKGHDYYVATCLWTNADGEKTATDRAALFQSLKAIN